jgi:6-phosphofructokinase
MGRQSGFITVQASLAAGIVDVALIPEVRFTLEGERGLLAYMEDIMQHKGHCVVCVAEGAGQVSPAPVACAAAGRADGRGCRLPAPAPRRLRPRRVPALPAGHRRGRGLREQPVQRR